jgi:trk system potassium uptake protein TrkA
MKVIIVGCGKLGSGLAQSLIKAGHTVTVIDIDAEALKVLGTNFPGTTIVGIGFDKDVLEKANIRMADAIVACSKSDETNALIGRIAKTIYRVPRVISRLYDPRKAEIYRTLGLQTISTTTWGVQRTMEMLHYNQLDTVYTVGDGPISIVQVEAPILLVGKTVNDITVIGEIQVVSIVRDNKAFLPTLGTLIQANDEVFIAVQAASRSRLKALLGIN